MSIPFWRLVKTGIRLGKRDLREPERLRRPAADSELGDEPVAVARVGRARVRIDVAAEERVRRSKRSAGSAAGRRARPTPRRSSPSARRSECRRRSRRRSATRAGRRTSFCSRSSAVRPGTSDARTCRSSIAIGSPSARREALHREHRLRRRDVQDPAEPRAGRDGAQMSVGARDDPACAHVLAEGRDIGSLLNLRLRDERARSTAPYEVALADELVERGPHRQPRDA